MVVGVDVILADLAAEDLCGAIGNHLVRIHVVTRPRACLERIDHELCIPFAVHHFSGGLYDGIRELLRGELFTVHLAVVEQTQFKVHERCGAFDRRHRPDERPPGTQSADGEVIHCALGLNTVQCRSRYLQFPQRIFFLAKFVV